jgi:hypothetical protein
MSHDLPNPRSTPLEETAIRRRLGIPDDAKRALDRPCPRRPGGGCRAHAAARLRQCLSAGRPAWPADDRPAEDRATGVSSRV